MAKEAASWRCKRQIEGQLIIVFNGTAATGKGTLAKLTAEALGLPHYDFGLLYRAIASAEVNSSLNAVARDIENGNLKLQGGEVFHGLNLLGGLRSEEAGLCAARLATRGETEIARVAQLFVRHQSFVADGRTISRIYPEAEWHFQLVADAETARIRRESQIGVSPAFLERRKIDERRPALSPRAVIVDTTGKSVNTSFAEIIEHLERAGIKVTAPD